MALDAQVDDLSNKHSTNSSLPADNSLFPIWWELLTVFSNSNEMGAAIHLRGKERSEFKALYTSTVLAKHKSVRQDYQLWIIHPLTIRPRIEAKRSSSGESLKI